MKCKPRVDISVYIDDLTIDGQESKVRAMEDVLEAAHGLIDACQDDLNMPIAKNKLAVVASDNGLANKVARSLGSSEYAQTKARNLGLGGAGHRPCEGFPEAVVEAVRKGKHNGHIIRAAGAEDRLCTF